MGHQTQNWVKVAELSEVTEGQPKAVQMGEGVALPSLTLTDGFTQRITSVHTWVIR